MSKIKTVIIEGDLIDSNGWHILLPLKGFLEALSLELFEVLCIEWDIETGKLKPTLLTMKNSGDAALYINIIAHERLHSRWPDMWGDIGTLSFKYLN